MKPFLIALLTLAGLPLARANDFDSRILEKYTYERENKEEARLRQLAEWSVEARELILRYLAQNGGQPEGVACKVANGYSCNQGACYLWGQASVALRELGAPGDSFRSCDFQLPGARSCRAELPNCISGVRTEEQAKRCHRAEVQVSCIDGQRQISGEYLYLGGAPSRAAPGRRQR